MENCFDKTQNLFFLGKKLVSYQKQNHSSRKLCSFNREKEPNFNLHQLTFDI